MCVCVYIYYDIRYMDVVIYDIQYMDVVVCDIWYIDAVVVFLHALTYNYIWILS